MSRIILDKYDDDDSNHVVVGWDHPARGAFWQEWATDEEIAKAEKRMVANNNEGPVLTDKEYYKLETLVETGVKREGGMFPGIPLNKLIESMPEELRPLMTPEVMVLLHQHADDPDSGRKPEVDLTKKGNE